MTKACGALAVLALGAAAVLLLLVVRPRRAATTRRPFHRWADEIRGCMDADTRAALIRVLSTLAVRKFTRIGALDRLTAPYETATVTGTTTADDTAA
ncbi:hypothetical protein OOK27_11800 [Streptomyces canus]|uniref:hypothetical protein n=1 Tax=Streptomyces canus TaxID=58343 RepID=UPI0022535984|nr:hypothetical protein [Streptomyces canus]MCX5254849.1 hypothetical protein [Streptomyces canus]